MYKKLTVDKDTYITNKFVKNVSKVSASVGQAATLDLFKLYGATKTGNTPNKEISRLLIHFDLSPLKKLVDEKKIDVNDNSFWCNLVLKDVYGGQPTPTNFTVNVFPLSSSFDEGIGRDVVYYSDNDACNWLSSSFDKEWIGNGCSSGNVATATCDYIQSSTNIGTTLVSQKFVTGEEDLVVDITTIISATLSNELPDSGFRISLASDLENNQKSYFVKRFGSRQIYDETKRPSIVFGFDDSINDDTQNLYFDEDQYLKLYNYSRNEIKNLFSGSSEITGSNCLKLKLLLESENFEAVFTGSQQKLGIHQQDGIYTTKVFLSSSNLNYKDKLQSSGSLYFTPVWTSFDNSLTFVTGSKVQFKLPLRSTSRKDISKFTVNVYGLKDQYRKDQEENVRVNIFDYSDPFIKVVKLPVELPGIVVRNAYYSVRDTVTNAVAIPFDYNKKSTKISSDSRGMFFNLDMNNLIEGRSYVIDIMIDDNGKKQYYYNASSNFSIAASSGV